MTDNCTCVSKQTSICDNHLLCKKCSTFDKSQKMCNIPKEEEKCYKMLIDEKNKHLLTTIMVSSRDKNEEYCCDWYGYCTLEFVNYNKEDDILTLKDKSGNTFKYTYRHIFAFSYDDESK